MRLEKLDPDGNNYALVVDQSILDQLGIDDDTLLEMRIDGVRLIFTPLTPERQQEIVREEMAAGEEHSETKE